jgi:tRNA modification GTPase
MFSDSGGFSPAVNETIIAPATAAGGAIAIVRLSGPESIAIASSLFFPAGGASISDAKSHQLVLGELRDDNEPLDECLCVVMRAPHSFTGEECVEFHCHGGSAIVSAIVAAGVRAGARLAEPGEFSRRAFLSGRLDLAQAEAVCDLVSARTELSRRAALRQLRGGVSKQISHCREELIDCAAQLEAHLDFPEEDIPDMERESIGLKMADAREIIRNLLSSFEHGRVAREGALVVLAGKPNAGKSSLFNALVGRERAIVTPHPGTTRDTIEATIDIRGIAVTLADTAGIRDARDEVEKIGIERTHEALQNADLVLYILDATQSEDDGSVASTAQPRKTLFVWNKIDLSPAIGLSNDSSIPVSATTRQGIETLEQRIASELVGNDFEEEFILTNARHAVCLRNAAKSLQQSIDAFSSAMSGEFVMVDLRDTLLHLGEITGERLDEQILDRIFSTFCLGK